MVAYSFDKRFVPQIENGFKRQTIRAHRRRHARPGEALQLYTGMRTKHCRKIRDDVICSRIDEVRFDLRCLEGAAPPKTSRALVELVAQRMPSLSVNGIPIEEEWQRETFAEQDGFGRWVLSPGDWIVQPFAMMTLFWMHSHAPRLFEGVMVSWELPK
jgi:hypothetical protein